MRVNIQIDIRDDVIMRRRWEITTFIVERFQHVLSKAIGKRIEGIARGKKKKSELGTDTMKISIDYDHTGESTSC